MCLAIPGKILTIQEADSLMDRKGQVSFGGIVKEVQLGFVPEAHVGDYVNVHVGFALCVIDEIEAIETLRIYEKMNSLQKK
ncbi:HypC/HybG/HupF family hydrogenase formation chaperone [candidate division KSB1 bacterium]|nr:HypC/HybG/HupF family hydrogenase formation chaperone [candidate division KSB1 bacterium]RQW05460.1 MAG: HypC/HybG/HupF family hydrogenase formation chaperone [candidate division KSB1 bacterium]